MIRIGKFNIGSTAFSVGVVFVVMSICAIATAIIQYRPEYSMPLSYSLIMNEGLALAATMIYGIILHFAVIIKKSYKSKNK